MCYMSRGRDQVGVRELRQGLSIYLRRVAKGETFEVTDRGRPVAVLAPLPAGATAIERLVAAGRATPPLGDLRDLGPPKGRRASQRTSKALLDLRAERL
jgi:prevent-host-death family protein